MELIVTVAILAILASAAIPLTRLTVKREKERELRYDLWQMRDAIDHYKDAADRNAFMTKVDSFNYPPDLQTLVDGVDVQGKKVRFLRRIPVDPMTGKDDWGMRAMQDDPNERFVGRAECVRCVLEVGWDGAERDEVQHVVTMRTAENKTRAGRLYAGGTDGGDADHQRAGGDCYSCITLLRSSLRAKRC